MNFDPNTVACHPKKIPVQPLDKFREEVLAGLKSNPKHLQSKYFYDSEGDTLFQRIMALPEYYLTRCELDIFQNKTGELAAAITQAGTAFDLIELGAGDATKSSYLLQHLVSQDTAFSYMPIDISGHILSVLDAKLSKAIPGLDIVCLEGEYFEMLSRATTLSSRRKVVLFLGSNIGNMSLEEAYAFCKEVRKRLSPGDLFIIGFDLKKHPKIILEAYNDATGITAKFNLNLLTRVNRELGGNFRPEQFEHYQTYDPHSGACRSYLVSLKQQTVMIGDTLIQFEKEETIFMEVSQKFSLADTRQIAQHSGFRPLCEVLDTKGWFVDAIWQV